MRINFPRRLIELCEKFVRLMRKLQLQITMKRKFVPFIICNSWIKGITRLIMQEIMIRMHNSHK